MREDVADVNDPPSVPDHRDEPVLISADVENRENVHASACGKSARTSTKCLQAARLDTPYQCNSDSTASLCVLLNSVIAALLMILTPY
jgi:hypothetical protein